MTTTAITPTQRAEWFALHDRAEHLARQYDEALHVAGHWIKWGIERDELDYARGKAEESARQAMAFWAERERVVAEIEAHPFDAEVQARRADIACNH